MEDEEEIYPELLAALSKGLSWEDAKDLFNEITRKQNARVAAVTKRLTGTVARGSLPTKSDAVNDSPLKWDG